MNRNISASVLLAAVGLLVSSSAFAQESSDQRKQRPMPGQALPRSSQPSRDAAERPKIGTSVPRRSEPKAQAPAPMQRPRESTPKPAPSAQPTERRGPSESQPRSTPRESLPRERKSVVQDAPKPQPAPQPRQTPAPTQQPKIAPAPSERPRQVPTTPSQPRERRTIQPPSPSKQIGPTVPEQERSRNQPPEYKVPSKGPRVATPTPRRELLDMTTPSENARGGSRGGRDSNVRFPDAPEVRNPSRGGDRDDDWGHDDDHDRDYDRGRGWRHGRDRWDRWDDDCWRRPVVYVPRRSHIVLGWSWASDDCWGWRPGWGWSRRSVWCDPCDNLIVTTCAPSWRYRWATYSGFSFSYSSHWDTFSLGVAYRPIAVPVYTSCAPVCGSAILWDRPSVIVGSTRWFPGTYVNNTTIIGTGSGVYDPNLNPPATASTMTLPTLDDPASGDELSATELDRAVEAMHAGRYDAAVDWLRAYVREHPTDGKAMRWLSVALLSAKNPDDATAMMRMAYSTDIGLAGEPLNRFELGLNQTELRDLVVRASIYANAHDTGSAWLMLGVLMQAEGRVNLAGQQFDKAAAAGCDPAIIERLKAVTQ